MDGAGAAMLRPRRATRPALRNTKQVDACFGALASRRLYPRRRFGRPARADREGRVMDAAADDVEQLLDEGRDPERVCLLATGQRHPEQEA